MGGGEGIGFLSDGDSINKILCSPWPVSHQLATSGVIRGSQQTCRGMSLPVLLKKVRGQNKQTRGSYRIVQF